MKQQDSSKTSQESAVGSTDLLGRCDDSNAPWTPEMILAMMDGKGDVPAEQLDPPHTYIRLFGEDNPIYSENVVALRNRMREVLRLIEHELAFCGHRLLRVECELLEVPPAAQLVKKPFHHLRHTPFSINRDAEMIVWVPFYPHGTLDNLREAGAKATLLQGPSNLGGDGCRANGCPTISSKIEQKLILFLVRIVALVTTRNFDQLIVPQRIWKDTLRGNMISRAVRLREKASAVVTRISNSFIHRPSSRPNTEVSHDGKSSSTYSSSE